MKGRQAEKKVAKFEIDFEKKLYEYCSNELKGNGNIYTPLYYKDYSKMVTTNNISEATALVWVFPKRKTIKLPSNKLVTIEWISQQFHGTSYINLSRFLNKHFSLFGTIYPTSYGIGILNLFRDISKISSQIAKWLNDNKIEYSNEYSDAGWVYRFRISKTHENIEKIKNLSTDWK